MHDNYDCSNGRLTCNWITPNNYNGRSAAVTYNYTAHTTKNIIMIKMEIMYNYTDSTVNYNNRTKRNVVIRKQVQ